jgi:tetratricopeptide (TPR) repeat protein
VKTLILSLLVLACSRTGFAQLDKVKAGIEYLQEGDYKNAISTLDETVKYESTKANATAWYFRGVAYLQKVLDTTVAPGNALETARASLDRALQIDPEYDVQINNALYSMAVLYFNKGVSEFSAGSFNDAYISFMAIVSTYGNGARLSANREFKSLWIDAQTNAAYAAINANRPADAAPLLESVIKSRGTKDSALYNNLIDVYGKINDGARQLATIETARRLFPQSPNFRNLELNYYMNAGKTGELLPRLEAALKGDPDNADLHFSLANCYEKIAYPKTAEGDPIPGTASREAIEKAELHYRTAIRLSPDNPDFHYNLGVLYYQAASAFNRQLMQITGTGDAEQKKYDAIAAQRDAEFDRALPFFEKAYTTLDSRAGSLTGDEKEPYVNSMVGMKEIYSRKGNKSRAEELEAKIKAAR